ncbi:efflux RND transporter periplasmic adaptor subunit [Paracoccus benzoatiresistens]|uniref:Efflux RND transporter periplasmic adaptor subunit n=1 Tax=Paracoccus benzoatiresistens TaxID=2997341 RepID=A0ABT4J055_9RHOB|nr:efflux RND transporter periplasmic adaptor subunit [Paracoccus sp. EF6]MCZ0960495.1 efflux RND transporter periplasmic adaptor subunit [Paracoccus sp. EF6]
MRALWFAWVIAAVDAFASPALAQGEPLRVELVAAQEKAIQLDLQLSGSITATDSVEMSFRQAGRVTGVLVDEGDRVKQGQELARLDSVQQDQALRVAEAGLAAARAALAQARQASDRAEGLLARGVGTRAARDEALQALSEAQGSAKSAESTLEQARRAVQDTVLRAPTDAVVTARDMAPGQIVGAAQVVLTIATLDGLEAEFNAPDHPGLDGALGASVRLDTIDIDRPEMRGTVTEISPLVDPGTGTVTMRVSIHDVDGDTGLLGAAVRGHVDIAADGGIVVPWTALMREGDQPAVWRVGDDNRVSLVPVTIDYFANDVVYLSDGISAGDIVVGAGSQLLYPGRQVQMAEVLR